MANIRQMGKRQVFELKLWRIHDYFSTLEPHIAELKNQFMLKIANAEAALQSESDEEAQVHGSRKRNGDKVNPRMTALRQNRL